MNSMSNLTKKALATAFLELLPTKPMRKITVSDIANRCGTSRMTFYYHFQDINDLLEWTIAQAANEALASNNTYETWVEGYADLLKMILRQKDLVLTGYNELSRTQIEDYLYKVTYLLVREVIDELAEGLEVDEKEKDFTADIFKYAVVGTVLDWIRHGMHEAPEVVVSRTATALEGSIAASLERFDRENRRRLPCTK